MKLSGEALISASREQVWQAINDPDVLRRCIPGCEDITQETPIDWVATVVTRVGPVKARFNGRIRLEDLVPPASCRIVGEGTGGPAGFAKGAALVRLSKVGSNTHLEYDVESEIGGKLAQIGSRLIEAFAKKYAGEFFEKFGDIVGQSAAAEAGMPQTAAAPVASAFPQAAAVQPTVSAAAFARGGAIETRVGQELSRHGDRRRFDPQTFTILVLAALLVFMTIMYAMKP